EAQPLERGQLRFGAPESLGRADRVGALAGAIPQIGTPSAHGLDEAMTSMGMPVDQARQHRHALGVDHAAGRMLRNDLGARADRDDPITCDRDRAILDDAALRIDGDHDPAFDEDIDQDASAPWGPGAREVSGALSRDGTSDKSSRV